MCFGDKLFGYSSLRSNSDRDFQNSFALINIKMR